MFESVSVPFEKADEQLWKMACQVFRLRRANPNTQDQSLRTYTDIVSKVVAKNLVTKHKTQMIGNLPKIILHVECNIFTNPRCQGFGEKVVSTFDASIPKGLDRDASDEGAQFNPTRWPPPDPIRPTGSLAGWSGHSLPWSSPRSSVVGFGEGQVRDGTSTILREYVDVLSCPGGGRVDRISFAVWK
jgi:hypothetical protein